MATIFKIKNSVTTTAAPTTLVQGEAAVNITDKKLWVGNAASSPIQLLGAGATVSGTDVNYTGTLTGGTGVVNLGSGQFYKDASGNIGVGTASPTQALTVGNGTSNKAILINALNSGTNGGGAFIVQNNGSSISALGNTSSILGGTYDANSMLYAGGSSSQVFYVGAGERMRIDSSGNCGIGTSAPGTKLQVVGTVAAQNAADGSDATGIRIYGSGTQKRIDFTGADTSTNERISGIGTGGVGILTFSVNNGVGSLTERMRIDSSGNCGIGTSSPSVKLQAAGDIGATWQPSTGVTAGIRVGPIGASTQAMFGYDGSTGNLDISPRDGFATVFKSKEQGTERMRIDSSGNLLVGCTSLPVSSPAVAGLSLALVSGNHGQMRFGKTVSGNVTGAYFGYNSTVVGQITYSDTATAYVTSSDYRLKENIAPMTGALDKVSALKPVTYKWKTDGSSGQGFIAHELQAVVPDCVTGEKDATRVEQYEITPAIPATLDEDGNELTPAVEAVMGERVVPVYQGIDTSFLVATLTSAIQEQQVMINELKAKVAALEAA